MSISPVADEIATAIQVHHVMTPRSRTRMVYSGDDIGPVQALMEDRKYDLTPVFGQDGALVGLLERPPMGAPATGKVADYLSPLTDASLVGVGTPVRHLLDRFEHSRFLLVIGEAGYAGLVTPADLDKQAGRTHLYMEIASLELLMVERLRAEDEQQPDEKDAPRVSGQAGGTTDPGWLHLLSPERQGFVRRRMKKRRAADVEVDPVTALDLGDLLAIHRTRIFSGAWQRLQGDSGTALIREISGYRHTIMHSALAVTTDAEQDVVSLLGVARLVASLREPLTPH